MRVAFLWPAECLPKAAAWRAGRRGLGGCGGADLDPQRAAVALVQGRVADRAAPAGDEGTGVSGDKAATPTASVPLGRRCTLQFRQQAMGTAISKFRTLRHTVTSHLIMRVELGIKQTRSGPGASASLYGPGAGAYACRHRLACSGHFMGG